MDYSPALSDFTDEELDQYFASYVPLSNLPTPPPAKEPRRLDSPFLDTNPLALAAQSSSPSQNQNQSPELQVYATHLANLVPLNVAPHRPSVSSVRGFLERACLPVEIVAFAACVLDALSQRFAGTWRDACLPSSSEPATMTKPNARPVSSTIGPDVVVLAALALAHAFVDDRGRSTRHWAKIEGDSRFTVREIESTKMAILRDMDYGLFRITEEMVQSMTGDMQRAGNLSTATNGRLRKDSVSLDTRTEERRPRLSLSVHGTAVWQHGVQTPEPSP